MLPLLGFQYHPEIVKSMAVKVCCCLMIRNTAMQFVVQEANLGEKGRKKMCEL